MIGFLIFSAGELWKSLAAGRGGLRGGSVGGLLPLASAFCHLVGVGVCWLGSNSCDRFTVFWFAQ